MTGKRMKAAQQGLDRNKFYTVEEAVKAIKDRAKAKFDETIEVAMNLGIDPKHADQNVRGVVSLPNGTGKTLRVAVFAKGGQVEFRAEKAGLIPAGVGKASFTEKALIENVKAFVGAISRAKPAGAKGTYIKKVSLASTMGPGMKLDVSSIVGGA